MVVVEEMEMFPEFLVGLPPLETAVATWIMWDVEDDEVGWLLLLLVVTWPVMEEEEEDADVCGELPLSLL